MSITSWLAEPMTSIFVFWLPAPARISGYVLTNNTAAPTITRESKPTAANAIIMSSLSSMPKLEHFRLLKVVGLALRLAYFKAYAFPRLNPFPAFAAFALHHRNFFNIHCLPHVFQDFFRGLEQFFIRNSHFHLAELRVHRHVFFRLEFPERGNDVFRNIPGLF